MTYVQTLQALIADREIEIARLEAELSAAQTYVRVLSERLETAEQRLGEMPDTDDPIVFIRRLILEAGQPMFIDDIVRGMGRPVSRDARDHVRRLLLPWARRREIFTRPRPGMYGLLELEDQLQA